MNSSASIGHDGVVAAVTKRFWIGSNCALQDERSLFARGTDLFGKQ